MKKSGVLISLALILVLGTCYAGRVNTISVMDFDPAENEINIEMDVPDNKIDRSAELEVANGNERIILLDEVASTGDANADKEDRSSNMVDKGEGQVEVIGMSPPSASTEANYPYTTSDASSFINPNKAPSTYLDYMLEAMYGLWEQIRSLFA